MQNAIETSPPISKRFSVVKRIQEPEVVGYWQSLLKTMSEGTGKEQISFGGPVIDDFLIAVYEIRPNGTTGEGETTISQVEIMVVLAGYDLPAGIRMDFPCHWAGFYIFNSTKHLIGMGQHASRASTYGLPEPHEQGS